VEARPEGTLLSVRQNVSPDSRRTGLGVSRDQCRGRRLASRSHCEHPAGLGLPNCFPSPNCASSRLFAFAGRERQAVTARS
jgi:hypothetical protein